MTTNPSSLLGQPKSAVSTVSRDITTVVVEDGAQIFMTANYDPKRWVITVTKGFITHVAVG